MHRFGFNILCILLASVFSTAQFGCIKWRLALRLNRTPRCANLTHSKISEISRNQTPARVGVDRTSFRPWWRSPPLTAAWLASWKERGQGKLGTINFWTAGKSSFFRKMLFFRKYKKSWRCTYFVLVKKLKAKNEIPSTSNFLRRSFTAVDRKIATCCSLIPPRTFLNPRRLCVPIMLGEDATKYISLSLYARWSCCYYWGQNLIICHRGCTGDGWCRHLPLFYLNQLPLLREYFCV